MIYSTVADVACTFVMIVLFFVGGRIEKAEEYWIVVWYLKRKDVWCLAKDFEESLKQLSMPSCLDQEIRCIVLQ